MTRASNSSRSRARPPRTSPAPPSSRLPVRISLDREALAALDKRALAAQVGIGLVAGWLASWVVGGSGLLRYVLTGMAGSFVGGFLLDRLGIDLGLRSPLATRIATATIGAVAVILAARLVS